MSRIINVQIIIDAEGVLKNYPNPSQDSNNPTGIGHSFSYMVATANAQSGSGTGDLVFSAVVGDSVRFFGSSASNNFENSVLIYNLPKFGGTKVFSDFDSVTFNKSGVSPSGRDVLPADITAQKFWFFEADVVDSGTENYKVQFALYTRDENGSPTLKGYYEWDPTITVAG